ncbi:hypothetical protein R3P38DRAFT_3097443 [Favolaschia claudopus]|uniref:Secreted protein n=1 Tax=Favolaschia claudopus TaxID=2862362 RepID=A0AAV9ZNR1_9AGAR
MSSLQYFLSFIFFPLPASVNVVLALECCTFEPWNITAETFCILSVHFICLEEYASSGTHTCVIVSFLRSHFLLIIMPVNDIAETPFRL